MNRWTQWASVWLVFLTVATRADTASLAWKRAQHIQHGVSTSEWFGTTGNYSPQQLRSYTTPADIEHIRQIGFDHIRIPVDPSIFNCDDPWEQCERVQILDQVITKAIELDLAVILDFHPDSQFTRQLAGSDMAVDLFVQLWGRIASHYAKYDPDRLIFEIMNEAESHDTYRWSGIEQRVLQEIRRQTPNFTVIVSGATWADIWDLILLPPIADDNLIYSFHYYEPHIFTHQGASWGLPWWTNLHNLPFPSSPESVAPAVAAVADETTRWQLTQYGFGRWNADRIAGDIAFIADWAKRRNVPLICDEFGVYRNFSSPDARERWLTAARTAFEKNHIGWTMWDYRGGFGVVRKQGQTITDDEGVLRALGLSRK